ncbi:MAG: right-handed parallel beta-helix repeat-containing protein, partial [Anaerolineae bacterium]
GGTAFTGEARWLEIALDCGDGETTLSPRQELTPSPYALHASTSDSVPWNGLVNVPPGFADGTDDDTQLSEAEVEAYVIDEPLNLAEGTTLGDETISTLVSGGCDAIQSAIDGLPPSGGQIVVKAGTYTCTQSIVIDRDNVDLRGQGSATILRLGDGVNLPLLVVGQTSTPPTLVRTNVHVSDLTLDGNRDNQDYECYEDDCEANPIRNNGITLRGVSDVLIERVTVIGARSGGLVAEKGCQRVAVHDFTAVDNHFDGLAAYETENSRFSGLHLLNNCAAGLSFDIDFNNNIIDNVLTVRDADSRCQPGLPDGAVGIFMRDSRDNLFESIQIRNTREHGIFLAQEVGVPGSAATGNTFTGVVVSGAGGAGLRANDATVLNTLVAGSQFIGNAEGCISEVVEGQVETFGVICR